jgi:hypothetical protein
MNEALKKLIESIETNRFKDYLMGVGNYRFDDRWVEAPTDLGRIFISGCNAYVMQNEGNRKKLQAEFRHAFVQMLKDPIGTWWVLSIIYTYLFGFKESSLLFTIEFHDLVPEINRSLSTFKEELKITKAWAGWRFTNGLWEDVEYIADRINEELEKRNNTVLINH